MEKFKGTLTVEQINGRHGPFCVGMLHTSIGQFKVKDRELDQFEPGSYRGQFLIEEIFTKAVPWRGGTFTELLARIADGGFLIDDAQQHDDDLPSTQAEPDPADEDHSAGAVMPPKPTQVETGDKTPAPSVPSESAATGKEPAVPSTDGDDCGLFGVELFDQFRQRAPRIALDPTVDRVQFRQQRERLKAVGYQFEAKSQQWVFAA